MGIRLDAGNVANRRLFMSSEPHTIKDFLAKHGHLLIYAGALIVFLTFVFKEGLGEGWRHLAEAVDSAQYAYSVRTEIKASDAENMAFMSFLSDLVIRSGKLSSNGRETKDGRELAEYGTTIGLQRESERIDASRQDLNIIIEKLPGHRYSDALTYIENGGKAAQLQLDFIESHYPILFPEKNSAPMPPKWKYVSQYDKDRFHTRIHLRDPNSPQQRAIDLEDSLDDMQFDVDRLTKEVLEDAEKIKIHNECLSKWAWRVTAALFALGWGIGLLGKIYRVESADSSTE